MNNAIAQHEWVKSYNWDDGLSPIWPIVESDETEFATALLIYWRMDGPWFERRGQSSAEEVRLHSLVDRRLREARYRMGFVRYYPITDNQLSRMQVAKLKRDGFPLPLLEPNYAT